MPEKNISREKYIIIQQIELLKLTPCWKITHIKNEGTDSQRLKLTPQNIRMENKALKPEI